MTKMNRRLLIGVLSLMLLSGGVLIGWHLRRPSQGAEKILESINELASKPSSAEDWSRIRIHKETQIIGGIDTQSTIVENLRPIFEAEANTTAEMLSVHVYREGDFAKSLIWSSKALQCLEICWSNGTVAKSIASEANKNFFLSPEPIPAAFKYSQDYQVFSPNPGKGKTRILYIISPQGRKEFPWTNGTCVDQVYFFPKYPIGLAFESSLATRLISNLLVIDFSKLEIVGRIPVPPQTTSASPVLLIDPNVDFVVCFDGAFDWILGFDIRPQVKGVVKPWPPPWPHPALGTWRGYYDLLRGQRSQWVEGQPYPERPKDF